MFHGISIVVQGSTVSKSSDKSFLMSLSLVCYTKKNEYAWFKFEKGNLSKYARQTWKTLPR